jgi:hypothetical protein
MQHTGLNLRVFDIEKLSLQDLNVLQKQGYFIAEFFFKDTAQGCVWLGKIQSIRYKEIDDKEHGQMFQVTEVVVKNPRVYLSAEKSETLQKVWQALGQKGRISGANQQIVQLPEGNYPIVVRNSLDNSSMIVVRI